MQKLQEMVLYYQAVKETADRTDGVNKTEPADTTDAANTTGAANTTDAANKIGASNTTDEANKTKMADKADAANKTKTADKEKEKAVRMMKSVLVRMGVRIKNIGPEQVLEKVGYLAGIEGFTSLSQDEQQNNDKEQEGQEQNLQEKHELEKDRLEKLPVLSRDVLVMKNFTSSRIDTLLAGLRKAGVPKIELKAVITPQNAEWTFYQLYQELEREHESLQK